MAWGAATSAYRVFGFAQTTTGVATSQVGTVAIPNTPSLAPAVAAGVDLGTRLTPYGALYAVRTLDSGTLVATMTSATQIGAHGGNAYIAYPDPTGSLSTTSTYSVATSGFGAGSVLSNGSVYTTGTNPKVLAIRWTDPGYSQQALVTFHVPYTNRGGNSIAAVYTIGIGATATTLVSQAATGEVRCSDFGTTDQVSTSFTNLVTLMTGGDKFIGIMWYGASPAGIYTGTGSAGQRLATLNVVLI
jgi:hypothetical protein